MLALVLVVYTSNLFTILDDLLDIGFLEDLDSIRLTLCEVLKLLISTEQLCMDVDERKKKQVKGRKREIEPRLTFSMRAYVMVIPGN
jgi:hypothetical protein